MCTSFKLKGVVQPRLPKIQTNYVILPELWKLDALEKNNVKNWVTNLNRQYIFFKLQTFPYLTIFKNVRLVLSNIFTK